MNRSIVELILILNFNCAQIGVMEWVFFLFWNYWNSIRRESSKICDVVWFFSFFLYSKIRCITWGIDIVYLFVSPSCCNLHYRLREWSFSVHMHNKKLQRQRSFYLSITHSTSRRNSWYTFCSFLFSSQIQIPISGPCFFRSSFRHISLCFCRR